ncbi:helix-turn-helix transcriptional regulator [Pseudonocardia benzenivorans]
MDRGRARRRHQARRGLADPARRADRAGGRGRARPAAALRAGDGFRAARRPVEGARDAASRPRRTCPADRRAGPSRRPGWFQDPGDPPHLATLARAVWSEQRVRIGYRRGFGDDASTVERVVEPLGLVLKAGVWYLVAGVGGDVRTYRAAKVVTVDPTGESFTRPAEFDLPGWWAESAARFAASMLRETVRLRLTPRGLRALPHVTDADAATAAVATAGPPDEEGRREVTLEVESVEVAAGQLVALAGEVEALEPGLRALLAAHGRRLQENNA